MQYLVRVYMWLDLWKAAIWHIGISISGEFWKIDILENFITENIGQNFLFSEEGASWYHTFVQNRQNFPEGDGGSSV